MEAFCKNLRASYLSSTLTLGDRGSFQRDEKRGFNLNHDCSRNSRSCFNWQGLSLLAFGIFELFRFSEAVKQKGDWPQSTLADKLIGQLLYRPTEEIFSKKCLLKRIQFRYHFVVELILSYEIHQDSSVNVLKTGQTSCQCGYNLS